MKKILYVDDEQILQKVTRIALERVGGFEVAVAGSGTEALALAESFRPDLILMDVMMPEMDGPTTLLRLRETNWAAEIPVVFITAKAQPEELDRFRAMGVAGVLTKPFDPMTLADTLRALWRAELMK